MCTSYEERSTSAQSVVLADRLAMFSEAIGAPLNTA